ncbi:hypothetical protein HID58_078951 [Brassica napus]|uniref:Phytocyanin domain-containing protein n=1 Tax=Brassica napus TaxID=3708 RepID=A0ABQ7XEH2_BRANA|nr:hypothetical protein HID58_078951 [Brassica napus]
MAHSPFLNLVLVFVTVASIFSTFAEANRGFGWGWGGGSNYSSSSGSSPGSGWGWGSSRNGSGWIWGSSPWSGWGWGWGPKNTNNSGSDGSGSGWGWGGHSKGYNATYNAPRKIIVGGDKEWTYGFNYSDWASKTAPFFLNDILVFKYNPPAPFTHSVYLFSNPLSYEKCDVKKGKMIASPKQGAGNGFELVLTKMKPYYISCGEHDGAHCSNGTMKFTVMPILPRWCRGVELELEQRVGWGWGSDGSSSSSSGPGSNSDDSSRSWGSSPGWGWSWGDGSDNSGSGSGSNSDGSGWGWGWGSDGSSSSGSGSGTIPDGSRWSWSWNPRSGWSWSWDSNHNSDSEAPNSSGTDSEAPSCSSSGSDSEAPRNIVVGGSDGWKKGLDYKEWAFKNAPFYVNDVLAFKYDKSAKRRNNVYLFQDPWSYMNCDLKNAKKIGLTHKRSEKSFKFALRQNKPYFFASGEHDGDYCTNHNMKFTLFPVPHHSD